MGWMVTALGIVIGLLNPQIGLLVFVIGLIAVIIDNTPSKPTPTPAKSLGALVVLIVGAVVFMMLVAAVIGAAGSF